MAKVDINGLPNLQKKLRNLTKEVHKKVSKELTKGALDIRNTAINAIQQQSSGRKYGNHTASKPGDAPNVDTGELIASIFAQPSSPNKLEAAVVATAPHARFLEFGTSKMAARPFLNPALNANEKLIMDSVIKSINEKL